MLQNTKKIRAWLKGYNIYNYQLGFEDGQMVVDVLCGVDLSGRKLRSFPVQFRSVQGCFDCGDNLLTSLKGVPYIVQGGFSAKNNLLTNLDYFPKEVLGWVMLDNNHITSLSGICKLFGFLGLAGNPIDNLLGVPEDISGISLGAPKSLRVLENLRDIRCITIRDLSKMEDSFVPENNIYTNISVGKKMFTREEFQIHLERLILSRNINCTSNSRSFKL